MYSGLQLVYNWFTIGLQLVYTSGLQLVYKWFTWVCLKIRIPSECFVFDGNNDHNRNWRHPIFRRTQIGYHGLPPFHHLCSTNMTQRNHHEALAEQAEEEVRL